MSNITLRQGFAPTTMGEAVQFSEMLARSQMVPKQYQGKSEDILVAVQWGYEIGLAPLQALQNISVINGKPAVYGDAAMALVQNSPICEDIEEYFENEGSTNPVAVCVAKRKGRKPVTARFSVEDAKRANLWGKQGPWTQYPKRMLQMRARGFALRDAFPDVLKGLITSEEAQDYPVDVSAPPVALPVIEVNDAEPQGEWAIMTPNGEIYAAFETLEDWMGGYVELAARINNSSKIPAAEKADKLQNMAESNKHILDNLTAMKRTAFYSELVQQGLPLPKSQAEPDSEPVEPEVSDAPF
jgi:RecT family